MTPAMWESAGLTCLVAGCLILFGLFVAGRFADWLQARADERLRLFYARREAAVRAGRECPDFVPGWLAGPFDQMRDEDAA